VTCCLSWPAAGGRAAAAPATPRTDDPREERVKMTRLRRTIARRLKDAQNTAALLTTFNEVDMTAAKNCAPNIAMPSRSMAAPAGLHVDLRQGRDGGAEGIPGGQCRDRWRGHHLSRTSSISASRSAANGLVVPVIRDAEKLSFAGIERDRGLPAARA
jgi:2-oxoglutarate dehydrogenase E2 component (dihydrolipoamide succinyltransferase)